MAYTEAKTFFNGIKIVKYWLLPALLLAAGVVSGIAAERYWHREECLKLVYENVDAPSLTDQEIGDILKILNAGEENNPSAIDQSDLNNGNPPSVVVPPPAAAPATQKFVGSRNSNKFYPVECRYAKRIKEENKVYFATREEGENQGRTYIECK